MKAIGIKVLKDNLSKYLNLVKEGEIIWVTDRDEVIAEIHRPTIPIPQKISPWQAFLNDEERQGKLKRAKPDSGLSLSDLCKLERPVKKIDLQKLLSDIKAD